MEKPSRKKLGILGGGQLAQMLALRAHEMGIEPWILSADKNDPAAQVTQFWQKGDLHNKRDLAAFLKKVDVATFESEFLNATDLKGVAQKVRTPFYPSPQVMGKLQDRWSQKNLLQKFSLPTSPFIKVDSFKDLLKAESTLGLPLVLKKRHGGYDGYGTHIIKEITSPIKLQKTLDTCPEGWIVEKYIPFRRELAVMAMRSRKGEVIFLPLVETFQENSRCFWVKGPIATQKWKGYERKIQNFLTGIKYVGAMGIELFETPQGLLVNEIAPRVHNSGHYSQDALEEDQFQLHIKCLFGEALSAPAPLASGFAMVNLLGDSQKKPKWRLSPGIQLHWYGKLKNRPGRKMGHLNSRGPSPQVALKKALKARGGFQL